MKKTILKSFFVIAIITLLSSCVAFHSGNLWDSALLNSANFSYIKHDISGDASATYVFGIGGLSKTALVGLAKKNMTSNNPLDKNQALVNLSVNFKNSYYFGIVSTVNCTVTADIVEFNNGQQNFSESKEKTSSENKIINIVKQNSTEVQDKTNIIETPILGTFVDPRDKKIYKTIKIGTQTWMAENLAFKTESGCWAYDNKEDNVAIYGYLYDWETAKKACPTGWHLPTAFEWQILINVLNGNDKAGTKLKSPTYWKDKKVKNINDINSSGFSALPAGYRKTDGSFIGSGICCDWWSSNVNNSNSSWAYGIIYDNTGIIEHYIDIKGGFSVRCIKD